MKSEDKKLRAIVYIDGYNLYYGLRSAYNGKYKWLDLQALAQSLIHPNMELKTVKYFTAISKGSEATRLKQEIYLHALATYCNKLEIIYGRFLKKSKQCRNCANQYMSYEEKETDVNIACQILNDAHLNNYDYCYVVSGDSDLVPPLKIVRQNFIDKKIIVANPPKRKNTKLCNTANGSFFISKSQIKNNQLPQSITNDRGNQLTKPADWI